MHIIHSIDDLANMKGIVSYQLAQESINMHQTVIAESSDIQTIFLGGQFHKIFRYQIINLLILPFFVFML